MNNTKPVELLELIKQNPDLPVIPFVDTEIVADDIYGYWMASWGRCAVDEYLLMPDNYPVAFKSDDDVFDTLEHYLPDGEWDQLPEEEEKCRPIYDSLPWKKAIIVYINMPEA